MEAEAIQTNSGVGLPPQYEVNPLQQGQGTSGVGKSEPPVDKVELSVAVRELAKEITDEEPHLQLSSDRLCILATGDSNFES